MQNIELELQKPEIEFKINDEIYGIRLTRSRIRAINELSADWQNIDTDENDYEEIFDTMENAVDIILGNEALDDIYKDTEPTFESLQELLIYLMDVINNYQSGLPKKERRRKDDVQSELTNRAERRRKK